MLVEQTHDELATVLPAPGQPRRSVPVKVAPVPRRVWAVLQLPPRPAGPAVLVVLAGLPGAGKSHLAAAVAAQRAVVIVRADTVRKALVPQPTYSPVESGRVYRTCHAVLRILLTKGYPTLFDATNLTAPGRRTLLCIARATGVPYFLVWVEAAPAIVRERLVRRGRGTSAYDSDADWSVYRAMEATVERPLRPDLVAPGTPGTLGAAVTTIVGFLDIGHAASRSIRVTPVNGPQQVT